MSRIIECAFIDNYNDMSKLNTSAKVKQMGTQVGKGIVNTLK
ncbi:N-acetylmuramoyl-L-alanine amidase [Metaclostridioides mangenotii]|uniref:N-acetylmuramoyl-L-alanine amidase n=1 Tax=Metaclostridioides mangenotii TaxID=1540 RepID=A0ABS4EBI5_9FIRM|nr:N-acetylmuramoyl-L-alanine amidase [Clostridioides mangenotii]MBP1855293.1 N-acetylmuramoyl-L-alanine amidase [Clostridioides mangenotii]